MKIAFANKLRGIAALLVIASHYYGSFFWDQNEIIKVTHSPLHTSSMPFIVKLLNNAYFGVGALGVSIFFLISGFVIPFSLNRLNGYRFLVARILRIYPTYWAALACSLAVIALSGWYWGNTVFPFTAREIFTNMTLFHLYYGERGIDFVNWTLAIEIKFYLIAWLLAGSIKNCRIFPVLIFCIFIASGNVALEKIQPTLTTPHAVEHGIQIGILLHEFIFVSFMFIGTLFYFHLNNKINTFKLIISASAIAFFVALAWKYSMYKGEFPNVSYNYIYGFLIFTICYCFRHHFRPNFIFDFFADISYPLYLIHALMGFCFLEIISATHYFTYHAAVLIVFVLMVLFAYILHRYIESYFITAGQKLVKKLPVMVLPDLTIANIPHQQPSQNDH